MSDYKGDKRLARSSRNVYLSEAEKLEAPYLYKALQLGAALISAGERSSEKIKAVIRAELQLLTNGQTDYVEVLSYPGLETHEQLEGTNVLLGVSIRKSAFD